MAMTYVLSGDDADLFSLSAGVETPIESTAFDESSAAAEAVAVVDHSIPWEDFDAPGASGGESAVFMDELPGEVEEAAAAEVAVSLPGGGVIQSTPAPTIDDEIRTRKLQLCDMIERVGSEIAEVEEEIAGLAAELKAAKKLREAKRSRLQELSVELKDARKTVEAKKEEAARGRQLSLLDGGEVAGSIAGDSLLGGESSTPASPTAPYNPWDLWEQGDAVSIVRVLVDTQGVAMGSSLRTYDVEPPQEGDPEGSLSGIVKAFKLNSQEIVELTKYECAPMLQGIEIPPVGKRLVSANSWPPVVETDADDSWQSFPVGKLDLPPSLVQILTEDNSIRTVGDISKWTARNRLTDLKKVGEAKAEKIEEALGKFWASR
jgi:hypothetical protein